jgi:hypothetical protein
VLVVGCDSDFNAVEAFVTTNGQTQVALDSLMYRVFYAIVINNINPLGDLYIAESDTLTGGIPNTSTKVKALILNGFGTSQMALLTVLKGKKYYPRASSYHASKGNQVIFRPFVRNIGGIFIAFGDFPNYQSGPFYTLNGIELNEGADIEIRGISDNTNLIASTFIDFISYNS